MDNHCRFELSLGKILPCIGLLAASAAAHSTEVAPYFYTWGFFNNSYQANSLVTAKQNGGVTAATLAFGVSGGGCTLGGGLDVIMNDPGIKGDVQQFVAQGGRVILSFGGADGQYLESACSENDMYNLIRNVIDTQRVYSLDFDVEGGQLGQTWLNTTRNNVIVRLQQIYPNLYVSFTLPVAPDGLPGDAITLLQSAVQAGVNVSMVNIMTMDYGSLGGQPFGNVAISSAQGTQQQLKGIFTWLNDAQLWAMIGITPMIGQNDDGTVFRQADATAVTSFAQQHGIGLLSFWALQRDEVGTGSLDQFSEVNGSNYEFYRIMAAAKSPGQPGAFPAGSYTIQSVLSGKCVDIDSASTADGAQVQQYQCNSTGAQLFNVIDMGNGWYKVLNANSGKAIDITGASTADGANVQQWSDNGTGAQRFTITQTDSADPTAFSLMNQNSSKCLDVKDLSTADRAHIQQWSCAGSTNQSFRFYVPGSSTPTVNQR
jgi:chitinase